MNAPLSLKTVDDSALHMAIASAIDTIAPSWPLDRMIAVNPYWGRIQQPFEEAATVLASVAGSPLTLPLAHYRDAWRRGEITALDLERALGESGVGLAPEDLVAALDEEYPAPIPLPQHFPQATQILPQRLRQALGQALGHWRQGRRHRWRWSPRPTS